MIIATRFRDLPDDQMKHVVDYVESGRPVIGLRQAGARASCWRECGRSPEVALHRRSSSACPRP